MATAVRADAHTFVSHRVRAEDFSSMAASLKSTAMLKRLSDMTGLTSNATPQTQQASTSTQPTSASSSAWGALSGLRARVTGEGSSSARRAALPATATPFKEIPLDLAQEHILPRLDAKSLATFGSTSKDTQKMAAPVLPDVMAREAAARNKFVAYARTFDPAARQVFQGVGQWLEKTRDVPIQLTNSSEFAALQTVLEGTLERAKRGPLNEASKGDALAMLNQLQKALDRTAVTARSAKPMGELLALDMQIARALVASRGGPSKPEADQMVTTMTSLALKHGQEAAVTLMAHAGDPSHRSGRLSALRFLGEALFQLKPATSKATTLPEYLPTQTGHEVKPKTLWWPKPTPQAETVKALFHAAFEKNHMARGSDLASDWLPVALADHGVPMTSPDAQALAAKKGNARFTSNLL